jgi:hypothetical protein
VLDCQWHASCFLSIHVSQTRFDRNSSVNAVGRTQNEPTAAVMKWRPKQISHSDYRKRRMFPAAWMDIPPGPSKPGTFTANIRWAPEGSTNPHLPLKPTECPHKTWALFSAWERPSRDILQNDGLWLIRLSTRERHDNIPASPQADAPSRFAVTVVDRTRITFATNRMPLLGLGGFSAWPSQARAF